MAVPFAIVVCGPPRNDVNVVSLLIGGSKPSMGMQSRVGTVYSLWKMVSGLLAIILCKKIYTYNVNTTQVVDDLATQWFYKNRRNGFTIYKNFLLA